MGHSLKGKKIAILVTDGFEESELKRPKEAFENAGAQTAIVSPMDSTVRAWGKDGWGGCYSVDMSLANARAQEFDALLLPGGVRNPDSLRTNEGAISFVKAFVESGKPIAAICHGPWTLIEANGVKNRLMTSGPSLKSDLENAGAYWIDSEVVAHRGLITSGKREDIPAFVEMAIEEIAEARQVKPAANV